ncbi:MAG: FHA domain-containing protein [Planctomycetota bacterium]
MLGPKSNHIAAKALFADCGMLGPDEFVGQYPEPFLVEAAAQTYGGGQRFQTRAGVEAFDQMIQEGYTRELNDDSKVFPVVKSTKTFPDKISIGRARNTDIIIPDGDLSKLHAMISVTPDGYSISDADSKNGTFVNGRRLEGGENKALADDDLVWFGPRISFRFLLPATFHVRLIAMGAKG